jgi:hypothetical protein
LLSCSSNRKYIQILSTPSFDHLFGAIFTQKYRFHKPIQKRIVFIIKTVCMIRNSTYNKKIKTVCADDVKQKKTVLKSYIILLQPQHENCTWQWIHSKNTSRTECFPTCFILFFTIIYVVKFEKQKEKINSFACCKTHKKKL